MIITIISPTYNEVINIKKLIPILEEKVLPKIKKHDVYILIVDDNSPDGTADEVRKFMKKWNNIHLLVGPKEGLGAAYVRGMRYAMDVMKSDAVIEFDADFQHDPQDIPRLIAAMDDGADYVIGSRYIPGGAIPREWGLDRKLLSRFGSIFASLFWFNFSIHDMTSGLKLSKSTYLKKIDLEHLYSKTFAYKLHILHDMLKLHAKVKEIPIIFCERTEGSSKINKKESFESMYVVLRLRLDDSKRVVKFLIVGGTGFIIQIVTQEGAIALGVSLSIAIFFSKIISYFVPHSDTVSLSHAIGVSFGTEASVLSNFLFNNFWTFNDTRVLKEKSSFFFRLLTFNTASFAAILIQFFAVWIGEKSFGSWINILGFVIPTRIVIVIPTIICIIIPLNYLIYNKIVWKTQYLHNEKNRIH